MTIILLFAFIFIGISLYMDPQYLSHYFQHGENFGIFNGLLNKGSHFFDFYKNIFMGLSSEYYLPQIKFQLLLFAFVFLLSLFYSLQKSANPCVNKRTPLIILVLGVNVGIFLIGRFNITSIIFIFPFMYLLTITWLQDLDQKRQWSGLLILIIFLNTLIFIPRYDYTYAAYLNDLSKSVTKDDRVLSNLNSEYFFENGKLLAYRNLQYLQYHDLRFADYIRSREIDYIIFYRELDYIVNKSPSYNVMYGDLGAIHPEIKEFLSTDCDEIDRFTNSTYGTNLADLIDEEDWEIIIYKVNPRSL